MTERYDVIVIGAGHNGLTCAGLLARAGRSVLVLEAADEPGGAARNTVLDGDCRVPACAHLLYGFNPRAADELGLRPDFAAERLWSIALAEDGHHLRYRDGELVGCDADAAAFRRWYEDSGRYAKLLDDWLNRTPPRLTPRRRDLLSLGMMGFGLRRLGRADMREFLRIIGMNVYDELHERFSEPRLRGALALDAVLGTHLGPRSPNTMLTMLYRRAAGHRYALPAGGMGAFTTQLADMACGLGATLRTGTRVRRVVVDNGRVAGVETDTGETIASRIVVSNADPKTTVLDLVGSRHVETGFTGRVDRLRMRGNAAKLNLVLDGLPQARGLEKRDFAGRFLIAPDARYVERAFNPAKYREYSPAPVIEFTLPSFADASIAPAGRHVLSAIVQYAPYDLDGGWSDTQRAAFQDVVLETLARYLPDLPRRVRASELLVPPDLEARFGLGGGHWHHGELTLDQFLFVRPVAGAAQYALPLDGLWLCGSGAHPGGNVNGSAGRNAAREILRREK